MTDINANRKTRKKMQTNMHNSINTHAKTNKFIHTFTCVVFLRYRPSPPHALNEEGRINFVRADNKK
jgi:hypothetical protein